ncbi:hypothetical protein ACQPT2_17470 [Erwinia amylovora]
MMALLAKTREVVGEAGASSVMTETAPTWCFRKPVIRRFASFTELKTTYALTDLVALHDAIRVSDEQRQEGNPDEVE